MSSEAWQPIESAQRTVPTSLYGRQHGPVLRAVPDGTQTHTRCVHGRSGGGLTPLGSMTAATAHPRTGAQCWMDH